MHPTTVPAPSASPKLHAGGVNLSLGTIGRIEAFKLSSVSPWAYAGTDSFAVLSSAHAGLPRPGSGLDGRFFVAPECPSLLVLAATHHDHAYYVIVNLADRPTLAAMRGAVKRGPLKFGLLQDGAAPWWSGFYFEDETVLQQLQAAIEARKNAWRTADDAWRDRLGLLVLELPARFAAVDARAAQCSQHSAILASGNRAQHESHLARLAADFSRFGI